jgi:tetratricopeptide (TPR) repeat protein
MRRFATLFLGLSLGLAQAGGGIAASPPTDPSSAPADETGAQAIEQLYARLAATRYPDEAAGILQAIDTARRQSGSDTGDLLMTRALQARSEEDLPLALQLFNTIVELYPDWSESWSERATTRFQTGDVDGAVGDLAQTLKREPRDIGALAGLGAVMLDAGKPDEALRAYDRALALAPAYEPLKEARTRAQTMMWSRTP